MYILWIGYSEGYKLGLYYWEDIHKNLDHFNEKLNALLEPTDIIILLEMFTTAFTMNPLVLAEEHGGEGLQWMQQKAKEKN